MTEERKGATPAVCPTAGPIIEMRGIRKSYYLGRPNELEILHGIDLTVNAGEFLAIVGESGSGKSTLMNIIGALDKPTQGSYWLAGVDVEQAPDRELSAIRNKKIGFVFQTYNLIGRQSALKNVELPMLYAGVPPRQRTRRAHELLAMVEMDDPVSYTHLDVYKRQVESMSVRVSIRLSMLVASTVQASFRV